MVKQSKLLGVLLVLVLTVTVVVLGYRDTNAAESTFAYVDTIQLWNEMPQIRDMRAELEQETEEWQTTYDTEAAKLESEDARKILFEKYQAELDARKEAMFNKAMDTMNKMIEKVAKDQGISVILEKQSVLYGGLDLTDKVIAAAKAEK